MKEVQVSLWEIDLQELESIAEKKPHAEILIHNKLFGINHIFEARDAVHLKQKNNYVFLLIEKIA